MLIDFNVNCSEWNLPCLVANPSAWDYANYAQAMPEEESGDLIWRSWWRIFLEYVAMLCHDVRLKNAGFQWENHLFLWSFEWFF